MIGGGGSGGEGSNLSRGGKAGDIFSGTVPVTPQETIQVSVGRGGVAYVSPPEPSSFGSKVVNGGDADIYRGYGDARTTCAGTSNDGDGGNGGQAGFGDGGDSRYSNGEDGGVGAGGGGCNLGSAGNGGRGEVRVSWQ